MLWVSSTLTVITKADGMFVGARVAGDKVISVGFADGRFVGVTDGTFVGVAEGATVGVDDGFKDGAEVGDLVGDDVLGELEGRDDGSLDGL